MGGQVTCFAATVNYACGAELESLVHPPIFQLHSHHLLKTEYLLGSFRNFYSVFWSSLLPRRLRFGALLFLFIIAPSL